MGVSRGSKPFQLPHSLPKLCHPARPSLVPFAGTGPRHLEEKDLCRTRACSHFFALPAMGAAYTSCTKTAAEVCQVPEPTWLCQDSPLCPAGAATKSFLRSIFVGVELRTCPCEVPWLGVKRLRTSM